VTQASSSNAETEDSGPVVFVSMHELARGLRPFHPPPPPRPQAEPQAPATDAEPVAIAARASQAVRELAQSTVLAALRGRVAEKQRNLKTVFAVRMKARRARYAASLLKGSSAIWHAISTRRQRKLKMKKHKFKKLLKRQKNEKRRLDRL
jgi:hypothetical protein